MRRGSGGAVFEPAQERRDRELTLGPGMLAALAVGLLTLCGVCFVFGYAVGHRSFPPAQASQGATPAAASASPASAQSKPSALQNSFEPHASQAATPPAADTATDGATVPPANSPAAESSPAAVVQTALSTLTPVSQPASSGAIVRPALPQGAAWMVQIAAVSHPEDADVLVGALRRRGYAVAVRRDPTDNLMHVQVGPFSSHDEASAMRQRLLNDGYNAVIQP